MQENPSWEANISSATQNFPRIVWNLKVHHRTQKSLPPVPTLSQIDLVYAPQSNLSMIHFTIILNEIVWGNMEWINPA
jgi:hypothetical protein